MKIKKLFSTKRLYTIVTFIIMASLAVAILRAIFNENWVILFSAILILILTLIPLLLRKKFKIEIELEIELITMIFIYASLFLGNMYSFYERFAWWDILLHATSAITFGFIGFTILYMMYSRQKVKAEPITLTIFTFSFAIAIGVLWEIFEFSMDHLFGFNMQRSGLVDTMTDLIINTIGAIIASTISFAYLKNKNTLIFSKEENKIN